MSVLTLNLLGNPSILLDQKEIFFSFSKINALLYYMVINGNVNRDQIAGILWEDKDNQTAKKNLRNTIYQVNKILGDDFIICPSRSILAFNPDLTVESDVTEFLTNPKHHLDLYKGDFLQGFYLKSNETFDLWLTKMRSHCEQMFIKYSYQKIEQMLTTAPFEEVEETIFHLIAIDEYEEKNYQLLMRLYQHHHRFGKVIEIYYKMVNLLDKELGIAPSETSQQIYEEVVAKNRNKRKVTQFLKTTNQFYGRINEIKALENYFDKILESSQPRTMLLVGGTGIGKRTVTRQVLSNQTKEFQIVTSECFREDRQNSLRLWQEITDGLGDLVIQHQLMTISEWKNRIQDFFPSLLSNKSVLINQSELVTFIIDLIKGIAERKATVILIEDIHFMDADGINLLQNIINHIKNLPVAFVLTKHIDSSRELDVFINQLVYRKQLDQLKLNPLSEKESLAYLHQNLDHLNLGDQDFQKILTLSQGNPFFLSEYCAQQLQGYKFQALTPAMEAKFSIKLEQVNSQGAELLNYLACFQMSAPLTLLSELLTLPYQDCLDIVEDLCHQQILEETYSEQEVNCRFHQSLFAIYCYDHLTIAKRRMMHAQIAQSLENSIHQHHDPSHLFNEISYHYKCAKQPIKALAFQLNYLESTLQFHHELFPIYTQTNEQISPSWNEKHQLIQNQFNLIRKQIEELRLRYEKIKDFQESMIKFLYLEGCYMIRVGQYQQGIANIQRVIAFANEWHHTDYLLEGYRQLIYYCIQVENIPEMKYYTDLALDASVEANNHEAIAINLRLHGLYYLMVGRIDDAIHQIKESINCFSLTASLQSKYAIQIAAALDYLAEIKQMQGNPDQAMAYQQKAITLSQNNLNEPSIISFYIGLGISYYYKQDFENADRIFIQSKEALKSLSFPWKETQLEVYSTLINCAKGDYQSLINVINKQDCLISRYSNPRDKGYINYLFAIITYKLQLKIICDDTLQSLLPHDFQYYYSTAKTHLNPYRDCQLIKELDSLNQKIIITK